MRVETLLTGRSKSPLPRSIPKLPGSIQPMEHGSSIPALTVSTSTLKQGALSVSLPLALERILILGILINNETLFLLAV